MHRAVADQCRQLSVDRHWLVQDRLQVTMNCAIIGDSIAVGVAHYRPECVHAARVGATSVQTLSQLTAIPVGADQILISVGSNDQGSETLRQAYQIRQQLGPKCVTWLLPNRPFQSRRAIQMLATVWGDRVLDTRAWTSGDHVHPKPQGYRNLASRSRNICNP